MRRRLLVLAAVLAVLAAIAWGAVRIVAGSPLQQPPWNCHHPRQTRSRHHHRGGPRRAPGRKLRNAYSSPDGWQHRGHHLPPRAGRVGGSRRCRRAVRYHPTGVQPARAEADLAEAGQQVIKASRRPGPGRGDRYQVESTTADVKLAELEIRKNPLLAAIVARQKPWRSTPPITASIRPGRTSTTRRPPPPRVSPFNRPL